MTVGKFVSTTDPASLSHSVTPAMVSSVLSLIATSLLSVAALRMPTTSPRMQLGGSVAATSKRKLLVIGGNGFVGREVCKYAVRSGAFEVTSLSRRGECPKPDDPELSQVSWNAGNALDKAVVSKYVNENDAVVHCIGLLFDVNSGLTFLNTFTSASSSKPDDESTYDNITRKTACNTIEALRNKARLSSLFGGSKAPFAFVSCAEAGWPDVKFGKTVDAAAPEWLQRYLVAKRAVEAELDASTAQLCARATEKRCSLCMAPRKRTRAAVLHAVR